MIVFDVIYFLLVLWTGWIVSRHTEDMNFVSQLMAAILIVGSLKNLISLFFHRQ